MVEWGLGLDARNLEAGGLEGADGRLTAGAGALDEHGDLVQAVLHGCLGSGLGGKLRRERGGLTGASKPTVPPDCGEITLPWGR